MNKLIFVILALFTELALAYPALNDTVTYHGKYYIAEADRTVGFIQELQIVEVDAQAQKYKITETLYAPNGADTVENKEAAFSEIKSKQETLALLANCEALGGNKVQLEVTAGKFDTCHFKDDKNNEVWLGDVPFQTVKVVNYDDKNRVEMELALYSEQK